jgi:dTDP-4-amino-4,6-dideoxygalactose transaminase
VKIRKDFLVFGSPMIEEAEIKEVEQTLRSGWIGTGPKVHEFEERFKRYKKAKYAVALNSCTAALHLCLTSIPLKPGDEVITTPLTFCATVNAIIHAGGTPVLADIDPVTMNIDPKEIEKKITKKTRVILPVHYAGRPCPMTEIRRLAKKHGLLVLEDCAHAIEAKYHGKPLGTWGDFGCFSFYVTKNIVTGEGGMVLAKSKKAIDKIKILGLHGMSADAWKRFGDQGYKHYYVVEAGFKYNMMDLQAALGIHQLQRVDRYWRRRRQIWQRYCRAFKDLPLGLPPAPERDTVHGLHLFTVLIDRQRAGLSRDDFLIAMTQKKIGVGVHYLSIPEHPYYQKKYGWRPEQYPNAMRIGRQTVSLPLSAKLSDADVSYVIDSVKAVLDKTK